MQFWEVSEDEYAQPVSDCHVHTEQEIREAVRAWLCN